MDQLSIRTNGGSSVARRTRKRRPQKRPPRIIVKRTPSGAVHMINGLKISKNTGHIVLGNLYTTARRKQRQPRTNAKVNKQVQDLLLMQIYQKLAGTPNDLDFYFPKGQSAVIKKVIAHKPPTLPPKPAEPLPPASQEEKHAADANRELRANAVEARLAQNTTPYANVSLANPSPVPASSAGPPEGYTGSQGIPVPDWARNRVEARVPAGVDMKEATDVAEGYFSTQDQALGYLQQSAREQVRLHAEELARMREEHTRALEQRRQEMEESKNKSAAERENAVKKTKEELDKLHAVQLEEAKNQALLSGYESGKYATIEHGKAVAATKAQIEAKLAEEERKRAVIQRDIAASVSASKAAISKSSKYADDASQKSAVQSIKKLEKMLRDSGGYTSGEVKTIIDHEKSKIKNKSLLEGIDSDTLPDAKNADDDGAPGAVSLRSSLTAANLLVAPRPPSTVKININKDLSIASIGDQQDEPTNSQLFEPISPSLAAVIGNDEIDGNGKRRNGTSSLPNGITNWQIDNIFGDEPRYVGTISRDQIKTIAPLIHHAIDQYGECGFIMNLDRLDQQLYEHWVAVFIDADHAKAVYYYDPFGEPLKFKMVKDDLDAVVKSLHLPYYLGYYENHTKNQNYSSNRCGIFSVMFIQNMLNGSSFSHACKVKEPDAMHEQRILEGGGYL